ncbi:DUF6457 domain-containing protein [Streptomyces sp. NPDC101115]|uniref:DUF6457 domain-containing protein n=1 Tax=Streptomyces sp. NPDC101115 TaxID=3366106 RepID=UPI00380DCCF3
MTTAYDAIVLAGGAARRLGGADKPGVRVGGRPLLDRVLAACRDAGRIVVVAEPRATAHPVEWAREEPPGGGPVAALDAGLRRLTEAAATDPGVAAAGPDAAAALDAGAADFTAAATDPTAAGGGPDAAASGPAASDAATRPDAAAPHSRAAASGPAASDGGARCASGDAPAVPGEGSAPAVPGEGSAPAVPGEGSEPAPSEAAAQAHPAAPARPTAPFVLVLSADLPFFELRTARRLVRALEAAPGSEGAVMVDGEGREQPLVAVYRVEALRRELERAGAELGGLPLRKVVGGLRVERVAAEGSASFDCDTWEDIATARARIREHGNVLDEWITAVKDELGIDLDVDTGVLLDLARDAAHGVARPAAPLTTFLVGYAAASAAGAGGGREAVAEAARKAAALAQRWAAEQDETG